MWWIYHICSYLEYLFQFLGCQYPLFPGLPCLFYITQFYKNHWIYLGPGCNATVPDYTVGETVFRWDTSFNKKGPFWNFYMYIITKLTAGKVKILLVKGHTVRCLFVPTGKCAPVPLINFWKKKTTAGQSSFENFNIKVKLYQSHEKNDLAASVG